MTNIDRRQLLSSLAAATACAPVVSTINAADAAPRREAVHKSGHPCAGWMLAKELRRHRPDQAVDFWARPHCDIPYTEYLPREIARGAMWYEIFERPGHPTLEEINSSFKHYCFAGADTPRRFAAHLDGSETLASTLGPLIEDEASNPATRTAFISLDSLGPLRELSGSSLRTNGACGWPGGCSSQSAQKAIQRARISVSSPLLDGYDDPEILRSSSR